ncbi:MAG TPA: guanylate kinase [Thermodesulfobacteriota bacterium]|nr:guanylate kinase [Deltaproteobacteria bacterium]HNR13215.1 guanylate kinase [Thermodesulfobacteriota bacterium]HNU71788.1 guanylate kinase [Thermodesulfobacteriota bacterium]HOC37957.1 guanylate kinase [Thermodesulfobacteriota bacterium]HQO77946.1 guanylate kinase [Thermodesulfobacteriota bacterium]
MKPSGLLCIVSGPSGTGKTSLCKELLRRVPSLHFSVSYTTRPPREGETQGKDYCFVSKAVFEQMIAENAFAEWAQIYHNYYGTTKASIQQSLELGIDLLFDIDPQGAHQLRLQYPEAVSIFVLPPSMLDLETRLHGRSTDPPEVIAGRLLKAREEISQAASYDYLIINDNFDEALSVLQAILAAEKHRYHRLKEKLLTLEQE